MADGTVSINTTSPAAARSGSASAFSDSTSFPPSARVAKISNTDMSKQTEVEARTPAYSSGVYTERAQRTIATALRCWIATPFGTPVDPEVKITYARLSARAGRCRIALSPTGSLSQPGSRNSGLNPAGSSSPRASASPRRVISTFAREVSSISRTRCRG